MIVPVPRPLGGALVLGESVIAYFNGSQPFVAAPIKQTIMRAAGMIDEDGSRFLLGDYTGGGE
jgi:DNA damage-binding protein 1